MRDPNDEAAAELVLALSRAVSCGVTVTREPVGYHVASADRKVSITVFDDGSTSPLNLTGATEMPGELRTAPQVDFSDPTLLRSGRQPARSERSVSRIPRRRGP